MKDFSIYHWLIVAAIVWFIYRIFVTRSGTQSDTQKQSIKTPSEPPLTHWESLNEFEFEIVGESFYQPALAALASPYDDSSLGSAIFKAVLVPEDNNRYDKLAVRVDINGLNVGHLSKDDARSFRRRLSSRKKTGAVTSCDAIITGGFTKRDGSQAHFGVRLDIKPFD
jgi:hypothetical protein